MARLTRNSYKRKIILFGVFIFMSIALISTGFAAWVLSQDDEQTTDGNVQVGIVADSSIDITLEKLNNILVTNETASGKFSFNFEPEANDSFGRVTWQDEAESMNLIVQGKITNPGDVKKLTFKLSFDGTGIAKAVEMKYIKAPEIASQAVDLASETSPYRYTNSVNFEINTPEDTEQHKHVWEGNKCTAEGCTTPEKTDIRPESGEAKTLYVSQLTGIVYYWDGSNYKVCNDYLAVSGVIAGKFSYTIQFQWGEAFGGINPSHYYDGGKYGTWYIGGTAVEGLDNAYTSAISIFNNIDNIVIKNVAEEGAAEKELHWFIGNKDTGVKVEEAKEGESYEGKTLYEYYKATIKEGETPLEKADWFESIVHEQVNSLCTTPYVVFGGPGRYSQVGNQEVRKTLEDLRACVYGYYDELYVKSTETTKGDNPETEEIETDFEYEVEVVKEVSSEKREEIIAGYSNGTENLDPKEGEKFDPKDPQPTFMITIFASAK